MPFCTGFLPQPVKTEKTFLEKFIKMQKFARMAGGDSSWCRPPEQRDTGREEAPLWGWLCPPSIPLAQLSLILFVIFNSPQPPWVCFCVSEHILGLILP